MFNIFCREFRHLGKRRHVHECELGRRCGRRRDINGDNTVDMKDIAVAAKNFGKTSSVWNPS